MKIEERLHDAMHEYANTIEPEPDSWSQISARFDEPAPAPAPKRGAFVLAGVALTLVIALIAVLVVRDGDSSRIATGPGGVAPMPSTILAITDAGRAVVLDSTTGEEKSRWEARGFLPGSQVAVRPDGSRAFVVQGEPAPGEGFERRFTCAESYLLDLGLTDPSIGLVSEHAGAPTVSPDGRHLAYFRCPPGAAEPRAIVLRDLTSGVETETAVPDLSSLVPGFRLLGGLSFMADSRHVAFDIWEGDLTAVRRFDIVAGEPFPEGDLSFRAVSTMFRGPTDESITTTPDGVYSTATGRILPEQRLFTPPLRATRFVSDRSGDHILSVSDDAVYRWSAGEQAATKIADGIAAAAWIPDAPRARSVDGVPARVVIAADGQLRVLGVPDGQEHGSFGPFPGIASVSSRFNADVGSHDVYFASNGEPGACDGETKPAVNRMVMITDPLGTGTADVRNLETRRLVGAAQTPVVSPDGRFVAFGTCGTPRTLGFLNLTTEGLSLTNPLGDTSREASPVVESVAVLGWSPDSRRLLYRARLRDNREPHYYVGRLWPVGRQAETKVLEIPGPSGITAAAFLDNETVVLALASGTGTVVVERRIGAEDSTVPLSTLFDRDEPATMFTLPYPEEVISLVPDPTGRHFLVVTEDRVLYRWSVGDSAPTKLADGVTAAAWLP